MSFNIKPIKLNQVLTFGTKKAKRRSLGKRDKETLYQKAKHKCEACGKKIQQYEMQVGHKKAYSKGGATSYANSVCLCYACNKRQGTGSLESLKKKLNGTFGKRTKRATKKVKRTSSQKTWTNPITGKKEKLDFFKF